MRRGTPCRVADCRRMRADSAKNEQHFGFGRVFKLAGHELLVMVLIWLVLILAACAAALQPDNPRTASTTSEPI